jgi:hypothetical protein
MVIARLDPAFRPVDDYLRHGGSRLNPSVPVGDCTSTVYQSARNS